MGQISSSNYDHRLRQKKVSLNKLHSFIIYTYTNTTYVCLYISSTSAGALQAGAPVLTGHQLGKPSDVQRIMLTHYGKFYIYYTAQPKLLLL